VIPTLAEVHLLGRGAGPLSIRSGSLLCGDALSVVVGRLLCKRRLRFLPLHTGTVVRCVVSPQQEHCDRSRWIEHPSEIWNPPQATHRGVYPQLRSVVTKRCQRWHRLHCSGPLGTTYDPNDNRKPQPSVSYRTVDTSGPPATHTMKWG
jgi:hypothetical protein